MGTTNRRLPLPQALRAEVSHDPWKLLRQTTDGRALQRLRDLLVASAEEDPASYYDDESAEHVDASPLLRGHEAEERIPLSSLHRALLQELGEALVDDFKRKMDAPASLAQKAAFLEEKAAIAVAAPHSDGPLDEMTLTFTKRLVKRLRDIAGDEVARLTMPPVPLPEASEGWFALAEHVYSQPEKGYDYGTVAWVLRRWTWLRRDNPEMGITRLYNLMHSTMEDSYPPAESGGAVQGPVPADRRTMINGERDGFPTRKTVKTWVVAAGLRWGR